MFSGFIFLEEKIFFIDPVYVPESFNEFYYKEHIIYYPEDIKEISDATCGHDHQYDDFVNIATNTFHQLGIKYIDY